MPQTVLQGLRTRRAELSAEVRVLNHKLSEALTAIGHLDAAIKQFDPDYRVRVIVIQKGARAEFTKSLLGMLRLAQRPLTLREMADQLMVTRGMDRTNTKLVTRMVEKVRHVMTAQQKYGTVVGEVLQGDPSRLWRVAD